MKILMENHTADREEWLKLRKIGSSDIAAICHLSPYKTPLELWAQMTGKIPPVKENAAMRMGTLLEPEVGRGYAERTGLEVVPAQVMAAHKVHEWATATPDFWVDPKDQRRILEAKTTKGRNAYQWETGAPEAYVLQLTWQLGICEIAAGIISVMIGGDPDDFRDYDYEFNGPLFQLCLDMAGKFWECVQSDIPPIAGPGDSKLVAKLQGERTEETIILPPESAPKIEKWKHHAQEESHYNKLAKQAKGEKERYAGQIMQLMGPKKYAATHDGKKITAKWEDRKGHIVEPYRFMNFKIN